MIITSKIDELKELLDRPNMDIDVKRDKTQIDEQNTKNT